MRRVIFLCLLILFFAESVYASTGGNTGNTGLWEYPTAEMPEDGTGRFGYTNASPYAFYFLDMAWLPWLEVNARFSTFSTIDAAGRRYMDKAIDLKAILWNSKASDNWIIPSIAVGVVDMMGTELMKAFYGVATWRWGDVALTIGHGSKRFNGIFGGIEWDINNWLTFKAEYSPLDYAQDRVSGRVVLNKLPSNKGKYNFGFVFHAPWGMDGSISYQRGDDFVFSVSQRFDLKGPFFGNSRKNFESPGDSRVPNWDETNTEDLLARIKSGLEKFVRVRDVDIKLENIEDGHKLTLAYENYGYSSHAEAMTRLLIVLASVMPETQELVLIHKNAGIPIIKAEFPGSILFDIRAHSLREDNSIRSSVFAWADKNAEKEIKEADTNVLKSKAQHELKAMLTYDPRADQTLYKAYMDRLNIDAIYRGRYSNGWGGIFDVKFPIYNHIDITDRTGLWWEKDLNNEIRIQQAGLTYANNFDSDGRAWFFAEGGYLNEEWFGGNFWLRYYGKNGGWWLGGRLALLHDRDPFSFGGLTEGRLKYYGRVIDFEDEKEWRDSAWVQGGFNIDDLDLDVEAEYGKYADEDKGYKISVTRHWDDTALGFWYIDTDKHAPNKDFTRAGVHMEIPAEKWFGSWFGNSSSHIYEQDTMILSTWDMESGRDGGKIRTPERMMSQLRPMALKKNVEKLLKNYCSYDEEEDGDDKKQVQSLLEYIFH